MGFLDERLRSVKEFTDFTSGSLKDIFTGNVFRKDFFRQQIPLCLLLVFFLFCHIGLRYSCEGEILEISKANIVLEDVKHDANTRSAELLGLSKQSRIQQMVEQKDGSLRPSQTPPIVIKE